MVKANLRKTIEDIKAGKSGPPREVQAHTTQLEYEIQLYKRPKSKGQYCDILSKFQEKYSKEEIENAMKKVWAVAIGDLPQANEPASPQMTLQESYLLLREILSKYMDMPKEHQLIVSLWIIGTYFHKTFNSFPFLFINAMRSGGKTRLLKIIEATCYNGEISNNISEAVLFRTAEHSTILIDEMENVGRKEKETLRSLFNSAYKRGAVVKRMRKKVTREGEEQVVETFKLYAPIAMANIWGMNDVLGDRCISLVLEKSSHAEKTKLLEDFATNPLFLAFKDSLNTIQCSLCSVDVENKYIDIHQKWNNFIDRVYSYVPTYITYTTLTTLTTLIDVILDEETFKTFTTIHQTGIDARNLEIYFSLFMVAKMIGEDVFNEIIIVAKDRVKEKKEEDVTESIDVAIYDFVSKREENLEYYSVSDLLYQFRNFFQGGDEEKEKWMTIQWFGRALKRLALIKIKRRVSNGMEVMLNVAKAKEKLKMFKTEEKP